MNKIQSNQIVDLLQYSTKEYEDQYLDWYDRFISSLAKGDFSKYVQMYQNRSIAMWFKLEINKLENQFISISQNVPNEIVQLRVHYKVTISQIFNKYPSALLEGIKPNYSFKIQPNLN